MDKMDRIAQIEKKVLELNNESLFYINEVGNSKDAAKYMISVEFNAFKAIIRKNENKVIQAIKTNLNPYG